MFLPEKGATPAEVAISAKPLKNPAANFL